MRKYLSKIDRLAAWILFIGMVIYFITGYGMTKGIISPELSTKLHIDLLIYFIFLAFFIHTAYAIRLALKRWKIWNMFTQILWVGAMVTLALFIIYAEFIYQKPVVLENNLIETTSEIIDNSSNVNTIQNDVKVFTLQELANYDGKNGQLAYVAVDGNIYDLTDVFVGGVHFSHLAGQNLTNEFYLKHAKSALSGYPVVGRLVE